MDRGHGHARLTRELHRRDFTLLGRSLLGAKDPEGRGHGMMLDPPDSGIRAAMNGRDGPSRRYPKVSQDSRGVDGMLSRRSEQRVISLQLLGIASLSRRLHRRVETCSLARQHHQYLCVHPRLRRHRYSEDHAPYLHTSLPDNETPRKGAIAPNLLLYERRYHYYHLLRVCVCAEGEDHSQ